ncbi:MAG TPA: iron-sulfur cluster assembly scaffold protein [Bryobacteraceae bacterium]|nr:iron-sulfur cluster assembly scaffold protein [Bryobacteraceae bacterium]
MYSERFLDHFRNPRNVGELEPPAETVEISNPACGDILRLSVRWENDKIIAANYRVRGCTASIAAGSAFTVWLIGRTKAEIQGFQAGDVEAEIGELRPESKHAGVLCQDAVEALLRRRA